jgi:arginase
VAGEVAIVALLCRTSDRTAGGARGAAELARTLATRTGGEARMVGSPGDCHAAGWEDDLRAAHGCLLEAGGQVEDALSGGRVPLVTAGDCSICMTTLPTVARLVPGVRIVWLDAHADFNTPETTVSGFLGGMCLAGACGVWDTGFDGSVDPGRVILVGSRDVETAEAAGLEAAGVTRLDSFADVADAVDGHPVYVHLDLDVLDPGAFPAQFPAPGGLSDAGLTRLLDELRQAAEAIVGVEVTAFEAPQDDAERARLATLAADTVMPLLPL